jgi:hypothetical protein
VVLLNPSASCTAGEGLALPASHVVVASRGRREDASPVKSREWDARAITGWPCGVCRMRKTQATQATCMCSSVEPVAVSVREFRGSAKRAKDVPLGLRPHGISTRAGTLKTNQSLETRTSTKHHHPLDGGTGKSSSLHQSQFDLITASGVCISIATLTMTRMHCNHCNSLLLRCFSACPW